MWKSVKLFLICLIINNVSSYRVFKLSHNKPSTPAVNEQEKVEDATSDIRESLNNITINLNKLTDGFNDDSFEISEKSVVDMCIDAILGRDMKRANEIIKTIDNKNLINYIINRVYDKDLEYNFDKLYHFSISIDDPIKCEVALDAIFYEIRQSNVELKEQNINKIISVIETYPKPLELNDLIWNFIAQIVQLTGDTDRAINFINSFGNNGRKILVYKKLLEKDPNNALLIAYNVKKLLQNESIVNSDEYQPAAETFKVSLPGCIKVVVFSTNILIKNVKYNEYITASNSLDHQRRNIFLKVLSGNSDDNTDKTWSVHLTDDFKSAKFLNKKYKDEFLYVSRDFRNQNRRITSYKLDSNNHSELPFKLIPVGDKCLFKSVQYNATLFASDEKHSNDERWLLANDKAAIEDSSYFIIESAEI